MATLILDIPDESLVLTGDKYLSDLVLARPQS